MHCKHMPLASIVENKQNHLGFHSPRTIHEQLTRIEHVHVEAREGLVLRLQTAMVTGSDRVCKLY